MKNLRGFGKRYFSQSSILAHSTNATLQSIEVTCKAFFINSSYEDSNEKNDEEDELLVTNELENISNSNNYNLKQNYFKHKQNQKNILILKDMLCI
jgi:hypothetical protein